MDILDISSYEQTLSERVEQAAKHIQEQWRSKTSDRPFLKPSIAIITGSGLGALGNRIDAELRIPYAEIPHFSSKTMPGHEGRLIIGQLAGHRVVCLQGRLHAYQGLTALQTALPVLVAHALGAETLIATNAAGAINRSFKIGQIMLIADHINFTGENPIVFNQYNQIPGTNLDMTYAYTPELQALALKAAEKSGYNLAHGVYLGLRGASFETPAEIRMFAAWGADAVGMSTIHEVIAASRLDMRVLGLSLITNMAAGILPVKLGAQDVSNISQEYDGALIALVEEVLLAM